MSTGQVLVQQSNGSYNVADVDAIKIRGTSVEASSPSTGNLFGFDGANYLPVTVGVGLSSTTTPGMEVKVDIAGLAGDGLSAGASSLSVDVANLVGAGLKNSGGKFAADYSAMATALAGSGLEQSGDMLQIDAASDVSNLTQSISNPPTQTEVDNIQEALNDLLTSLRNANFMGGAP